MHAILSKVLPHGNGMRVIPLLLQKRKIQYTDDYGHCLRTLLQPPCLFPFLPSFQFLQRNPHHTHLLPSALSLWHTSNFIWRDFLTFISYLFLYFTSQPQFTHRPLLPVLRLESAEVSEAS